MTLSEVEVEAMKVVVKCVKMRDRYGPTSWELNEQIAELKHLANVFKIIIERQPDIQEWLNSYPEVEAATLHTVGWHHKLLANRI